MVNLSSVARRVNADSSAYKSCPVCIIKSFPRFGNISSKRSFEASAVMTKWQGAWVSKAPCLSKPWCSLWLTAANISNDESRYAFEDMWTHRRHPGGWSFPIAQKPITLFAEVRCCRVLWQAWSGPLSWLVKVTFRMRNFSYLQNANYFYFFELESATLALYFEKASFRDRRKQVRQERSIIRLIVSMYQGWFFSFLLQGVEYSGFNL